MVDFVDARGFQLVPQIRESNQMANAVAQMMQNKRLAQARQDQQAQAVRKQQLQAQQKEDLRQAGIMATFADMEVGGEGDLEGANLLNFLIESEQNPGAKEGLIQLQGRRGSPRACPPLDNPRSRRRP